MQELVPDRLNSLNNELSLRLIQSGFDIHIHWVSKLQQVGEGKTPVLVVQN